VDPLASEYPGWTPYAYVLNNPLRYNDPTGLCAELINASAGSYEGEAAQNLYQQHCSGTEPAGEQVAERGDPEQNSRTSCVGLTCDVQNTSNLLTSAGYASGGMGAAQIGMMEYRKSLPYSSKIGTFSRFSAVYSNIGLVSRGLGAAAGAGSVISVGIDGYDVYSGNLSLERLVERRLCLVV
jgi:hypothetical protein